MLKEYRYFKLFWGDTHTNVHGKDIYYPSLTKTRLKRIISAARQHLDFFAIAYYPFEWYSINGLNIESSSHRERFDKDWKIIQEVIAESNKPNKFVTFLGYEWHGNRRLYGDHNIYYLRDYAPLDYSQSIEELYANLRIMDGIAIPHHTGYQVGNRGKDWNFHDENLSPIVEIYSSHGSSEGIDTLLQLSRNINMGPGTSGGTIQDGLNRGLKFGIIASGDNHNDFPGVWGNGLAAVFSRELTREAIWDSFKKRHVYGVTGDRIKLYFSINGHIMGDAFKSNDPASIKVEAIGSDSIDRIEIIKNGRLFYRYSHHRKQDMQELNKSLLIKMRLQFGWGPTSFYGFKSVNIKKWKGSIKISNGKIVSVEPCFTYFGQTLYKPSKDLCKFIFTTQPRIPLNPLSAQHHSGNFQGAIFEINAFKESIITIQVNQTKINFSLEEALKNERIIAFLDEAKSTIYEHFGLKPEDIENHDVYWHNAWKMKIHKAIPYSAYHAKFSLVDRSPRIKEDYYYVRVIQKNGQMAWSSPIWIDAS
ncbi:MAG: DUF3604 domain-containing protein [Nitrososphaeria archaeon]